LPPLSEGDSKLGEVLNLIKAVTVSEVTMLNSAASTPDEIVTVADSETLIVAALAEVAMFSAAENEEDEVKVGVVVSALNLIATLPEPPSFPPPPPEPVPSVPCEPEAALVLKELVALPPPPVPPVPPDQPPPPPAIVTPQTVTPFPPF
jgi:hypothetical protein